MNKEILNDLKRAIDELSRLLSSLNQTELNTRPFDESWTAAQVGEHLRKSYGVVEILASPVKPTKRAPDEKIGTIKQIMLNFETKMKSPEFIIPSSDPIDREDLLSGLQNISSKIQSVSSSLDLSETCTGFSLPGIGEFTRLEWLHFMLYHTQRHLEQLKNIRSMILNNSKIES